jgi:hypothetical protein
MYLMNVSYLWLVSKKQKTMKKDLFFLLLLTLSLGACNNRNNKEARKRIADSISFDSITKNVEAKERIDNYTLYDSTIDLKHPERKYSAPESFLGLNWLASKQEAIKYLKSKDSVKIIRVIDINKSVSPGLVVVIDLSGFFAGQKVEDIILSFYMDKFCTSEVNFGIKDQDFIKNIVKELASKYGKFKFNAQPNFSDSI